MNFSQVSFGLFSLDFFGLFVGFAFLAFSWGWYIQLGKNKLSTDYFVHYFWRWVLVGILVGRIFEILLLVPNGSEISWISLFEFWDGGVSIYGFMIGSLSMMWYDFKKTDFKIMRWLDAATFPLLYGLLILDLGIYFTGAFYGTPTSLVWGIKYETIGVDIISSIHPISIYALVLHLLIFLWSRKKRVYLSQQFGALFMIVTSIVLISAFLLRFITSSDVVRLFNIIDLVQIIQICIILSFLWALKVLKKKGIFDFFH